MNSYRSILNFRKEIFVGPKYYNEIEPENEYDIKDVFHDSKVFEVNEEKPKVPKKKVKKLKLPEEKRKVGVENEAIDQEKIFPEKKKRSGPKKLTKIIYDEKFELVKNQCGRHELSSMAYMLNLPKSSLSKRLELEGIKFTKKVTEWTEECDICKMKKNNDELKRDLLIPFLRFNSEKDQFECILCNWLSSDRRKLYFHIRSIHGNEISAKAIPDKKSENNQECDGTSCKKVYGRQGKQFWCMKCLQKKQLAEEMKKKESKLCPECGVTVQCQYLEAHRKQKHNQEKQNCNICLREFPSRIHLTAHRRYHHEKIPCSQCGKLFAARYMNQHIQLIHTTDDQETYLPEHKNGKNYTVKKFGKLGKRVAYIHEGFTYHKMFKNRTTLRCQWARSLTRKKCTGSANLFLNSENPNLSYIEEKNPHNHENKFGTQ